MASPAGGALRSARHTGERAAAAVSGVGARAKSTYAACRARWGWFDHLMRAAGRYQRRQGNQHAAAVAFYGFLSVFPLAALAFALVGYGVSVNADFRADVVKALNEVLPGLANELPVDQIARAKVGASIIGLLALLYIGMRWIDALRVALHAIWLGETEAEGKLIARKAWDAGILVLLGLTWLTTTMVVSLVNTGTHSVLHVVGLHETVGAGTVLRLLSTLLVAATDTCVFLLLFKKLSGTSASVRELVPGAVFAAIGLAVLKLAPALLVSHVTSDPVYASFAVLVGLLVWIYIVSRFMLFAAAWTATRPSVRRADAPIGTRLPWPRMLRWMRRNGTAVQKTSRPLVGVGRGVGAPD